MFDPAYEALLRRTLMVKPRQASKKRASFLGSLNSAVANIFGSWARTPTSHPAPSFRVRPAAEA